MRQIALVFRIPEREIKDENGNFLVSEDKRTQRLHIPVCTTCSEKPNYDKIKLMMKNDLTLRSVIKRTQFKAVFDRFEVDPVIAGQKIEAPVQDNSGGTEE